MFTGDRWSTGFTGGTITPTWGWQLKVMSDSITVRLAWIDANLKSRLGATGTTG